jgi:hypothetical protein
VSILSRSLSTAGLACALLLVGTSAQGTEGSAEELRRAASAGDLAKVKELVAAGVDVNAANAYGGTALAFAVDRGHAAVVDFLLDHGADPNAKDTFYGSTPLEWALDGDPAIVRSLLEKGAKGEEEALVAAAGGGQAAIVKIILDRHRVGAETLSDALAAATQANSADVRALLEAAGAKPHPTVTLDPALLASYAGIYGNDQMTLTFAVKDGKLAMTSERGMSLTWVANDSTTFRAEEIAGFKITFEVESGVARALSFNRGGTETELMRKESP